MMYDAFQVRTYAHGFKARVCAAIASLDAGDLPSTPLPEAVEKRRTRRARSIWQFRRQTHWCVATSEGEASTRQIVSFNHVFEMNNERCVLSFSSGGVISNPAEYMYMPAGLRAKLRAQLRRAFGAHGLLWTKEELTHPCFHPRRVMATPQRLDPADWCRADVPEWVVNYGGTSVSPVYTVLAQAERHAAQCNAICALPELRLPPQGGTLLRISPLPGVLYTEVSHVTNDLNWGRAFVCEYAAADAAGGSRDYWGTTAHLRSCGVERVYATGGFGRGGTQVSWHTNKKRWVGY